MQITKKKCRILPGHVPNRRAPEVTNVHRWCYPDGQTSTLLLAYKLQENELLQVNWKYESVKLNLKIYGENRKKVHNNQTRILNCGEKFCFTETTNWLFSFLSFLCSVVENIKKKVQHRNKQSKVYADVLSTSPTFWFFNMLTSLFIIRHNDREPVQ